VVRPQGLVQNPALCHIFSQTRGEIMQEFSLLEYNVRSYLAHFLELQRERPLNKYKKQFNRFLQFFDRRRTKLNPKVFDNPDVKRMDAELMAAADPSFSNCLNQLLEAAEKASFSKMEDLRSLKENIKSATHQRNLLTHSVWIKVQEKILMQNFPDYHKRKWMSINKQGKRLTPQPSPEWTLRELNDFSAHLHDLSERLENVFRG
jgi:hypothetical protein